MTQAVADNLAQWMLNPPFAVFNVTGQPRRLEKLAGDIAPPREELLLAHLDELLAQRFFLSRQVYRMILEKARET